jgi:uncharacterized membrane protein YgdD (TMEM256/DUF423 family)
MTIPHPWLLAAALSGGLATLAGAYGAHGLEGGQTLIDAFKSGVQYHMWHSLALLAVAWITDAKKGTDAAKWAHRAGCLFAAGIVLFCGALYAYGMQGTSLIPGMAPLGGITLMGGWALLAFAATRKG